MLRFVGLRNILPADEWMARATSDRLDENDLCLTFDDALRCQYDVALPVLEKYGLTAFWFVYSGGVRRAASAPGNLSLVPYYPVR